MKVVVYGICKNEEKFVKRWVNSMREADQIVVLDTGSSDHSAEWLRNEGAVVETKIISPWRFDTARNRSLDLVPEDTDICVCTDLDEVFHPGWRKQLEKVWKEGTGQARYRYTWSFTPEGREGMVFWIEKIHARHGYRWVHPVHEVLEWTGQGSPGLTVNAEGVQLDHHPDPEKSRAQYLPLLELSVKEAPEDDRNMHYLGREYLYRKRWDDCICTLTRHLSMPSAVWKDERAASMRYIAKAFWMKKETGKARDWYLKAITEAPYLREGYMDLANLLYEEKNWDGVLYFTGCALNITARARTYISEASSWGSLPYDLRTIAFFETGRIKNALEEAKKALESEPGSSRFQKNLAILEEKARSLHSSV